MTKKEQFIFSLKRMPGWMISIVATLALGVFLFFTIWGCTVLLQHYPIVFFGLWAWTVIVALLTIIFVR